MENVDLEEQRSKMRSYSVVGAVNKRSSKGLRLKGESATECMVEVARFAPVGKGDTIVFDPINSAKIFSQSSENSQDLIPIAPHFEIHDRVKIGNVNFKAKTTEVSSVQDIENLEFLEQFHYKTNFDLYRSRESEKTLKVKSVGGRRAVLMRYLQIGEQWICIAYIDLQMPLMMCKPRHSLFKAPYDHPVRDICWNKWDQHAIRKYVNLIVRIARVVVNPEFRGLGIASQLVEAAKQYCRERWQIGGRRPIFLEISAEMLKYVDFVSSSGFRFVDETEGNLSRVVSDMNYMSRGYDVASGIMSLQKKYLTSLQDYANRNELDFSKVAERLNEIVKSEDPSAELTADEWVSFRKILRFPIPYYLYPLDEYSSKYLEENIPPQERKEIKECKKKSLARVSIKQLSVEAHTPVTLTKNIKIIMDSFGLVGDRIYSQLVPPTDISASAGNVILIAGTSGSGKSVLLQALDPSTNRNDDTLTYTLASECSYRAGWMRDLPGDLPIFEYFAEEYGPERAFTALAKSGLSEAMAMIKPYWMLSQGQRYRARLADLLLQDHEVWLIDEFCTDLDPLTAKIVAHKFRKFVRETGRVAFVAAANNRHYLEALKPAYVLVLRQGGKIQKMSYGDYRDGVFY